jgi:hypothetical protein
MNPKDCMRRRDLRRRRDGSAVLVVIVLLACIATIVVANSQTLHLLKEELKQIDRQQMKEHGQSSGH